MYGCQQNLINLDAELKAILEFICSESHKLTNCGIYYARQLFFKTQKIIGKYDLEKEYKINKHYQVLHSQAAQQILIKRGMYRTGQGQFINADLNGAANILRKVETQLGLNLVKVCRRVLTLATRFRVWETKAKKRNGVASVLRVATV